MVVPMLESDIVIVEKARVMNKNIDVVAKSNPKICVESLSRGSSNLDLILLIDIMVYEHDSTFIAYKKESMAVIL